jgi:hypothetical protein
MTALAPLSRRRSAPSSSSSAPSLAPKSPVSPATRTRASSASSSAASTSTMSPSRRLRGVGGGGQRVVAGAGGSGWLGRGAARAGAGQAAASAGCAAGGCRGCRARSRACGAAAASSSQSQVALGRGPGGAAATHLSRLWRQMGQGPVGETMLSRQSAQKEWPQMVTADLQGGSGAGGAGGVGWAGRRWVCGVWRRTERGACAERGLVCGGSRAGARAELGACMRARQRAAHHLQPGGAGKEQQRWLRSPQEKVQGPPARLLRAMRPKQGGRAGGRQIVLQRGAAPAAGALRPIIRAVHRATRSRMHGDYALHE